RRVLQDSKKQAALSRKASRPAHAAGPNRLGLLGGQCKLEHRRDTVKLQALFFFILRNPPLVASIWGSAFHPSPKFFHNFPKNRERKRANEQVLAHCSWNSSINR